MRSNNSSKVAVRAECKAVSPRLAGLSTLSSVQVLPVGAAPFRRAAASPCTDCQTHRSLVSLT